nr:galectin-10-like [Pongo abelii]
MPHRRPVSLSIGSFTTIRGTPILPFINDPELRVEFYTGMNENSDIAFHFLVHFGHCLVIDSHVCGAWKCEGRCRNVFFKDSRQFDLSILVLDNEYQSTLCLHCYSQLFSKI